MKVILFSGTLGIYFLLSTCALLSIHNLSSALNAGPGGLIGDFTASILVNNFSVVGSTILLVTFFIIGITLWLKLSADLYFRSSWRLWI